MKVVNNEINKIYMWSLGFMIDFDTDTDSIVGKPNWIFSLEIVFLRWNYYLEIHSERGK